jgi:hypothetical protein
MARPKGPVKLTQDVADEFLACLSAGVPARYSSMRVGVSERSIRSWVRQGDDEPDGPYSEFAAAVKKARGAFVYAHLSKIGSAKEWQSSAWLLERLYPREFGQQRDKIKQLEQLLADTAARIDALVTNKHPGPHAITEPTTIDTDPERSTP